MECISAALCADHNSPRADLKILMVNTLANKGGSQLALLKLARSLRVRGHDVHVRFLYGDPLLFSDEANVQVLAPGRPTPKHYLHALIGLMHSVKSLKPAATISFLPLANIMTALVNLLVGSAVAIASHRSPVVTYGARIRWLDRILGAKIYDHVVCVSQAVADGLEGYPAGYRDKISVIHNGVVCPALSSRSFAREAFGLNSDDFVFVAIGRLTFQKNYPALLRWFAESKHGHLLIAGEGEDRAVLETIIGGLNLRERVRLLGNVRRPDVGTLLSAADAFLQPSRFEGQSNAVLEAMAAGLPMILSDIPEQREVLAMADGNAAGLLVDLEDDEGWVRALDRLRTNNDLRQRLSTNAASHAAAEFSEDKMIDRFEALCVH
jgi:glycosyltransferase involved in cell wall biosynthesis